MRNKFRNKFRKAKQYCIDNKDFILALLSFIIAASGLLISISNSHKIDEVYTKKGKTMIINSIDSALNTLALAFEVIDSESDKSPISYNQLDLIVSNIEDNKNLILKIEPTSMKENDILNIQLYINELSSVEKKLKYSFNDIKNQSEKYMRENKIEKDNPNEKILNRLYIPDIVKRSALENIVIQIKQLESLKQKVTNNENINSDYKDYFNNFKIKYKEKFEFYSNPENHLT